MYSKFAVELLVLLTVATSVLSASVPKKSEESSGITVLQKVYDDCQDKSDFTGCLKGKALTALTRAVDQDSITLVDGISLVKQHNAVEDDTPVLADARTLSFLSGVDRALVQKFEKFFKSHTIKVDMAEGRGKDEFGGKKSSYRYVIAAMLTAMGIAGPIGLKALATIAGKALVISKVALTIAGIIALKKIFSSDHHEETSFQVHAGGDHNRRNVYVRPSKSSGGAMDPYRYYYEQQMQNQLQ